MLTTTVEMADPAPTKMIATTRATVTTTAVARRTAARTREALEEGESNNNDSECANKYEGECGP